MPPAPQRAVAEPDSLAATEQPLKGKVALVTGGGTGLGKVAVLALAHAGADVSLGARRIEVLQSVAAQAEAAGVRALTWALDVTNPRQVDRLVDCTIRRFGRLDIVINNAGVLSSTPLLDMTEDEWDRVLDTNLRGTFLVTRAAGRHLVSQGSGKIVNIASNFAFKGVSRHAAYSASKAAIVAFTRAMAVEWAPYGVQVNALAPGFFATDLNADVRANDKLMRLVRTSIPMSRIGHPDDLRWWVVHLASSASDFMTGEVITIDGGEVAW